MRLPRNVKFRINLPVPQMESSLDPRTERKVRVYLKKPNKKSLQAGGLSQVPAYGSRRSLLLALLSVPFMLIVLQLGALTILWHPDSLAKVRDNVESIRRLDYPRGNIWDGDGRLLATNRKTFSLRFSRYRVNDSRAREVLGRVRTLAGVPDHQRVEEILKTRPTWTLHTLLDDAALSEVFVFEERLQDFPGIRVAESYKREYPFGSILAHVTGFVGKIQPQEVEIYRRPRYLPDADVGRSGLEKVFEDRLAGYPGREQHFRDARGRPIADSIVLEPSRPGEDLFLTLDATWQAEAMRLLAGHVGSVVVVDVETGGVRVLASRPTFDPVRPGAAEVDGESAGWLNRAIQGVYPPGSTLKPFALLAALEAGVPADRVYTCHGPWQPVGWLRPMWCAHRAGHGPLAMRGALASSCNVYFYELSADLGPDPLLAMVRRFGFGEATGIGLPGERTGQLAASDHPGEGETANLYIGQGTMLATPLQVARAYAALAAGGRLREMQLVRGVGFEDPGSLAPGDAASLRLSPAHLAVIHEGLHAATNRPEGTAYKARFPREWAVCGKTGTAENGRGGLDAWFAGFWPRTNPRHAFVVHVEDADGHGGDVAAPIARELIRFIEEGPAGGEIAAGG